MLAEIKRLDNLLSQSIVIAVRDDWPKLTLSVRAPGYANVGRQAMYDIAATVFEPEVTKALRDMVFKIRKNHLGGM